MITGANAAGKTSLLEAIYFLSRCKSFRSHRVEQLQRDGADFFQITAQLIQNEREVPVGIRRTANTMEIRMGGEAVRRVSELVAQLPLVSVTSDLHRVLEEGPRYRRQFLDWGLFHVEPRFHAQWTAYGQALKQRNACLRAGVKESQIRAWDPPLIQAGKAIDAFRMAYLDDLKAVFAKNGLSILNMESLSIAYSPGWAQRFTYEEALQESLARDREQGYTRVGPHRADLSFFQAGQDLRQRLSRGQQKQLVIALMLAQAEWLRACRQQLCIFLLDDLPAELDQEHQQRVLHQLQNLDAQVFVSAISAQTLDLSAWQHQKMFHVEHGAVQEVI